MGYEKTSGLGVNNQYGARNTGFAVGIEQGEGSIWELGIDITGESLNSSFLPPVNIPKGALFKRAFLRVDEAFVLGGTTPAVSYGATGSVGTNFFSLSQAELQTIGTKTPASTGAGTWAQASTTGTTANALIAVALTGTTPTVDKTVGKATLVLEFFNKTKI